MLRLFNKPISDYFSKAENDQIVQAIKHAEQKTSGEVRIYIEKKCKMVNPVHRAKEIFFQLAMDNTKDRNAVLIYLAMKDRQLAIYGDEGIHQKVGQEFWLNEVKTILAAFNSNNFTEGLVKIIHDIGEALLYHFPYDAQTDKNELPDEIIFGK